MRSVNTTGHVDDDRLQSARMRGLLGTDGVFALQRVKYLMDRKIYGGVRSLLKNDS